MIPKKLISYCMFAIFAFNYSDAFGMAAGIEQPTSQDNSLQEVLFKFMSMDISMELNGVNQKTSVKNQWKRFIEYTLEKNQITHNVSGLLPAWYDSFIKKINIESTRKLYLNAFQEILDTNNYLSFNEFFSDVTIKNIFIDLGKTFVNSLPNSPAKQAEKRLLDLNINTKSAKTVAAANEFLNIDSDGIVGRQAIEDAYTKKMEEIKELELAAKEQLRLEQVAKIAKQVLDTQLVVPAPSPVPSPVLPARRIKTPTVDHQPQIISDAFRQRIQDVGMSIAKKMLEKNILVNEQNLTMTLQDLNIVIWGMENNQSEKMAYLMGYVQNCIYQLQKSSGNSAPMIVNLAEVLKVLNQKAARA